MEEGGSGAQVMLMGAPWWTRPGRGSGWENRVSPVLHERAAAFQHGGASVRSFNASDYVAEGRLGELAVDAGVLTPGAEG